MNRSRPETELLLLCAAPLKSEKHDARVHELLDSGLDWEYIESLAESHRLLPLLYWQVNARRPGIMPPALTERFQQNLQHNLLLTAELFHLLELLNRENIPAIPFKGPTLAVAAYGNLALRSFVDLDILVRPADIWRARDAMSAMGYKTSLELKPARRPAYLRAYDELLMRGAGGDPLIELHWAFVPPYFSVPLETAGFWENGERVLLGNRAVPALKPEDLLLALCLHGSKHCWTHLGLIADVAWLVSKREMPWEELRARARQAGMHRMVLLALALASEVLEAPLAEPVARAVAGDRAIPDLVRQIVDALFGTPHDETAIFRSGILHMRMRERRRDRMRYGFRLLTRPRVEDWQMIDLPRSLSFLYSLLRYPRLALKYRSRVP
jgi:hypothetical protein